MITRLKDILATQKRLMGELLALLERETSELLHINLDAMSEINSTKESMTVRINEHTIPLRQAVSEIATNSGLPLNASLVDVVSRLGKKGHKEIPRLYQDLNSLAKQVKNVTALNMDIAERSVAMIKNTLFILAQILDQSSTYDASGSYYKWQVDGIIISKDI
ncbi:MAG: flagellar protein FlgN [Desulfuromonadaceae bacterium]|nr:flagellar protein FlgN [Desulfuromonadaceae bacterium]MDD5105366.1 flagellar protein FlgN [Desulfuromonadaceae bacterium]